MNLPGSGIHCFPGVPNFDAIAGHDVVVVQRCCTTQQFDALKIFHSLELKVVYDLDDNMWDIPKENPAAQMLGHLKSGFAPCIQMVDVVTVSTKTLAKVVRKNVPRMINMHKGKEIPLLVVENRIDTRLFAEPVKPQGPIIVGWAGSSSHVDDLRIILPVIEKVAPDYPDVIFQFRGMEPPVELRRLPNVEHKGWAPVPEFGCRMPLWGWSIALAPVTDHPFNHSKSCIKMIESAYCGVPCLASWVTPYEEFAGNEKRLKWLLCPSQSSWEIKLRALLDDAVLRQELGHLAKDMVHRRYSWERPHEGWQQVERALGF
jgi:glycosyltransferase involved in cell wall biosynthesis